MSCVGPLHQGLAWKSSSGGRHLSTHMTNNGIMEAACAVPAPCGVKMLCILLHVIANEHVASIQNFCLQATGVKRACKIVRRWDERREPDHKDRRRLVLREIAVLTQLEAHPAIVHLIDAYED